MTEPTTGERVVWVADRNGVRRGVSGWDPSKSLMQLLIDNDFPILASCGGTGSCATCHVLLEESVYQDSDRDELAQQLLEDTEHYRPSSSVLSCQVGFSDRIADSCIEIVPEEL